MWTTSSPTHRYLAKWPAVLVWAFAWLLMLGLDASADLANLALVLVLASALCGLWLSALESVVVCACAVLAFNWQFVPPRGTFTVDLRQHIWLLLTMLGVGSMVAWLMGRQRRLAEASRMMADHSNLLRAFTEQLRDALADTAPPKLAMQLQALCGVEVCLAMAIDANDPAGVRLAWGTANPEEMANLRECQRTAGSEVFTLQEVLGHQALTLPIRGQRLCHGAALLRIPAGRTMTRGVIDTAQALCDQTGLHLERTSVEENARRVSEDARSQKLRNTLLAAISHDYRTPLANILGAASSLVAQSDRLSREQARTLATTIVDEVEQLSTMTDNTLQLARLDAGSVQVKKDWESLEELVGSAVARARNRYPDVRIGLRMEPALPLLRCNAQLILQLLDNLVDNAVKYGGRQQTVEIIARKLESELLLSVADRGPGIPTALRERVFQLFERGDPSGATSEGGTPRGTGLGLALCRAIVSAHGGHIHVRSRQRGGTSMDCRFPLEPQPAPMDAAAI